MELLDALIGAALGTCILSFIFSDRNKLYASALAVASGLFAIAGTIYACWG